MGQQLSKDNTKGDERRAFKRYTTELVAKIGGVEDSAVPCVIKDYCVGGMYADLHGQRQQAEQLALAGNLVISCDVQHQGQNHTLKFPVRVARLIGSGVGLSFLKPDVPSMQILHAHANQLKLAQRSAINKQKSFNGKTASQVLLETHKLIGAYAPQLVNHFYSMISSHFMAAAAEAKTSDQKTALYDGLGILNRNKQPFSTAFCNGVIKGLKHYSPHKKAEEEEKPATEISMDSLSLVDDDEFDHWLLVSGVVNEIDNAFRPLLGLLEKRLSVLYRANIDRENNPYGPLLMSNAFQEAINGLGLAHAAIHESFEVFRLAYDNTAEDIYNKVNQALIDNDVLANYKYEVTKSAASSTDTAATGTVAAGQNTEATAAAVESKQPPAAPAYVAPQQSVSTQDILNLVSDLRSLQTEMTHAAPREMKYPAASQDQLVDVLSSSEFAQHIDAIANDNRRDYTNLLESILANKLTGKMRRQVGIKESKVLDVAGSIFSSLIKDMQVSDNIRPWIKKLEVPLLKLALFDHTIFTNMSHPARQVVNKLTELEVQTDSADKEQYQNMVSSFDGITDRINQEFDGTSRVFVEADKQLDQLLQKQKQDFDSNIKAVIAESSKQDKVEPVEVSEQAADEEVAEWEKRVKRLAEGDWVLFDVKTDHSQRLKVGWIANRTGKYIFVNAHGKKERVYKLRELAEMFNAGNAVVFDDAEQPAMDRAQYNMLQSLHKQLLFQTTHDQLTGLMNRREFEKRVYEAIGEVRFSGGEHSVAFINLDKFSVINNSCGYEGGDALLRELADILKKDLPEKCTLARLGGDEFGLLLEHHSLDEASEVLNRKLEYLHDYRFKWDDKRLSISMSMGLVLVTGHEETVTTVLQAAESSCSVAKETGGHRIQRYQVDHEMLTHRKEQLRWAAKIDRALDEDNLLLRCQRIMPLSADDSYHDHYEILLGMRDEFGQQSSLQEFIRAAEMYKRMSELDRWVIENSFNWIADNRQVLDHISSFSINLSGHSLNDDSLLEFVKKKMRETNVPIGKICFEITETLGIANLSDAANFITNLKTTGCLFSLDDFGSGMSSYGYLKSLPVDFLKIDGVFVADMAKSPNDYAVVKSICEIGHFMGKKVIAEYVQDENTIKLLKEIGVDYAQGYAIEKPHSLDRLV